MDSYQSAGSARGYSDIPIKPTSWIEPKEIVTFGWFFLLLAAAAAILAVVPLVMFALFFLCRDIWRLMRGTS